MGNRQQITLTDDNGFYHRFEIEHKPLIGCSYVYSLKYEIPISHVEGFKLSPPLGDDDLEWEIYEEKKENWEADRMIDIEAFLKEYIKTNPKEGESKRNETTNNRHRDNRIFGARL
jgi:hypothetical protein